MQTGRILKAAYQLSFSTVCEAFVVILRRFLYRFIVIFYPFYSSNRMAFQVLGNSNLPPPSGGILPSKRLMGMCRWMESHFHDWIDYNGVVFSTEVQQSYQNGVSHFPRILGRKAVLHIYAQQTYQNVCTVDEK